MNINIRHQPIFLRKFTLLFSLVLIAAQSAVVYAAISLPEAINQQLSPFAPNNPNRILCGALLGSDKAENVLSGGLKDFCSEQLIIPQDGFSAVQGPTMNNGDGMTTIFQTNYPMAGSEQKISTHWSLFSSVEQISAEQAITALADASTINKQHLNSGFNYLFSNSTQLGIIFHITSSRGNYKAGGDFSDEGYGLTALADIALGEEGYLQFSFSKETASTQRYRFAAFTILSGNDVVISSNSLAKSDFNYSVINASALLGNSWILGITRLTPSFGVNWQRNDYGSHSEVGDSGLEITTHNDTINSLQALVGIQASWVVTFRWGVWAPQLGADLIQAFENDNHEKEVSFTADKRGKRFTYNTQGGDSSYISLSAGNVFILKNGWQIFTSLNSIAGYDHLEQTTANIGIRADY